MTHISWREVPLLIRCVPVAAKMPWVRLRCLLFNCLPSCSFRICLKCTDEAMNEILYCCEMWQCNDQIHAIEVWNHWILNWIQIEMDIFCPCRSDDVFVVVLLHVHPPPPFILSLDYGRIFFPSWNWTLKGNSWKLTFKRKWMDSQHRHLKVFCTAIASSEINCGTCIYPCCVLYLFCSTSPFSHFVQYIFGFLWQIFCVSSFTPPGLHSVHQSVTSTRCIYSWTGAFSFLWADVLLFVCFGVFFVTV